MFFLSLSSTEDEGSQGMRTSMSRISMGSHGVIVTDWSLDTRCAFQAGVPNSCSVILFVCLQRLRAANAAIFCGSGSWFFGARPRRHRARSRSVCGRLALSCVRKAFFCSFARALAASMFARFAAKSASKRALRSSQLSGGSCGRGAAAA